MRTVLEAVDAGERVTGMVWQASSSAGLERPASRTLGLERPASGAARRDRRAAITPPTAPPSSSASQARCATRPPLAGRRAPVSVAADPIQRQVRVLDRRPAVAPSLTAVPMSPGVPNSTTTQPTPAARNWSGSAPASSNC